MTTRIGKIERIAGPLIEADGLSGVTMFEVCKVGKEQLIGEVNRIVGQRAYIQVYEETAGLKPGEEVIATGMPLSVELGPGLVGSIFDGIQRPLPRIKEAVGDFITRGVTAPPLPEDKEWHFQSSVEEGARVSGGDVLGTVQETSVFLHRILVPPRIQGKLVKIAESGDFTIKDPIARIQTSTGTENLTLAHRWPVRLGRPYKTKIGTEFPLFTGQRVIDTFFPVSKGGTGAIPGGFGTGKCVTGDTPVLMADGDTIPIQELYAKLFEKGNVLLEDPEEVLIQLRHPVKVLSLDGDRYMPAKATHIYKGMTKAVVEITTRTGRKLRVTPVHKLFQFNGETIVETEAHNLKVGDYLAVPRKLRVPGQIMAFDPYGISPSLRAVDPNAIEAMMRILRAVKERMPLKTLAEKLGVSYDVLIGYWTGKNKPTLLFLSRLAELAGVPRIPVELLKADTQSKPFRVPKRLTKELAEWLGLFVAEGHLKGTHQGIFLYNTSEEILKRFEELTLTVFGLKAKLGRDSIDRTPYAVICNTAARKFLHYLGIPKEDKARSIRIPYSIRVAPEEYLVHFLAGYFAGDGGFYRYTVSFSTVNKALYSDLSYLLVRLGVLFRTRTKNGSYLVEVEGESAEYLFRNLAENDVYRYSKLEPLCQYAGMESRHFTGLDIVPVGRQLLSMLAVDYNDHFGYDLFRAKGIRLSNYTTLPETPSLAMLRKMGRLIVTHEDSGCSGSAGKVISILKTSEEIYYDRICKIVVKEANIPVFDITVERTHNFVGGIVPSTFHNTVMLHQLAKWADADIILYVGCGERGNEMTEVLEDFPKLKDPKSGKSLMERTVLVANTSNMPVAAREASIYTGVTLAEYFRDQGYDVALMADSTSRWAEALREISGRLEEMPGEEGFPAYLGSRLAQFYERAGHVKVLGSPERTGSVTITGAVSPPGGDFSEPVTQSTLRITKVFWALDKDMASRRFFPAINYLQSYSLYKNELVDWYQKNMGADWPELTEEALTILQRDKELREIVQLVGPDALPERERAILEAARMVKEDYLMQSAVHPVDTYCPQLKSYWMLKMIMDFWQRMKQAVEAGVPLRRVIALPVVGKIARMKVQPHDDLQDMLGNFKGIEEEIRDEFLSIESSQ